VKQYFDCWGPWAHPLATPLLPNRQPLGAPSPDPHLDSMTRECSNTLLPLNIFDWCKCLAILGQNKTYILCFPALPPPCPKIVPAPLRRLIFIDVQQIQHLQINWNIVRNIICFIMNVLLLPDKNFQPILFGICILDRKMTLFR